MSPQRAIPAHLAGLLSDDDLAAYLGKTPKTLANWRYLGTGPRYVRVGGEIRYRESDVATWLDENTVSPGAA